MAVDLRAIFASGGRPLIDSLEFCVRSVRMDPVFAFLEVEFRLQPTSPGAIALYDVFCAPEAPARLSTHDALRFFSAQHVHSDAHRLPRPAR